MSTLPVYVGLDYHQDSVQVCVVNAEGRELMNRSVANDVDIVRLNACRYGVPRRIAIEACCGAADLAEELVTGNGLPVELAHPGYVSRMKRSKDKHDHGDARLLADLTRVNYLPTVWLAPEKTRELRHLVRHRAQLVRRKTQTKLRIRGLLRERRLKCPGNFNAWTKRWYEWLLHEAELSRFCGVTPRNASSGARQADAGLVRAGNPELRHVLIQLSHRLISRIKGRWADLAHRMMKRGKQTNVVVAAIANRWVRCLFHEMKTVTPDN